MNAPRRRNLLDFAEHILQFLSGLLRHGVTWIHCSDRGLHGFIIDSIEHYWNIFWIHRLGGSICGIGEILIIHFVKYDLFQKVDQLSPKSNMKCFRGRTNVKNSTRFSS